MKYTGVMVCHVVCSPEKVLTGESSLIRSDKLQWNAPYYSADSSYEWEECLNRDVCRHIIHVDGSLEEANNYPPEWVKELFGFRVHNASDFRKFICFTDNTGLFHRVDGPAVECNNGTVEWYMNGVRHRVDGPAVEHATGDKEWFANGKLNRENGPAVEYSDGTVEWWFNDMRHRIDGPAVEFPDGTCEWWVNGKLHRENGPAAKNADGRCEWWLNGELHRVDGPAVIRSNGEKAWYRDGFPCDENGLPIIRAGEQALSSEDVIQTIMSQPKNSGRFPRHNKNASCR